MDTIKNDGNAMRSKLWDLFLTIVASGVASTIATSILSANLEKKISSYELKIEKYSELGEELSRLASNNADLKKLDLLLNGALIFGSRDVILAVQELNKKMRENKLQIDEGGAQIISRDELMPIIKAIRTDLGESNNSLEDIWFFQMGNPKFICI